ncbi:MAG TPA: hypothetical protein VFQ91_10625 [Bryobacteraceae bacterium]|nr:hypothetical protein [Bryobacteraceae bacterium]
MRHSTRWLAGCLLSAAIAYGWQQQPRPKTSQPKSESELEKAVEEFKVLTRDLGLRADAPRKRARTPGTGPSWHGRIFENFRNDKLDATPHEVVQRGGERNLLRRNQFGFNVGGPVVIPKLYDGSRKTFFNVSYEGVRERIGRSFLRTIAIPSERTGDFSQTVDNAGLPLPVYDPASTRLNPDFNPDLPVTVDNLQHLRDPFPNNQIPVNRLDPVAMKAVSYYPLPNSDAGPFFRNNYFVFSPESNKANGMIFKVDHSLAEKHRVTFNGSFTNGKAISPRYFDNIADSNNNDRDFSARRAVIDWTYTKSAATIHTFTADLQSDRSVAGRPGQENAVDAIGLRGPLRDAFPVFRYSTYLGMGRNSPIQVSSHNYYYLTESFSLRSGKHRLRGVGQYRRYQVNAYLPSNPAGAFQFGPSITSLPGINNTGHPFASFLLGLSESASATIVDNPSYWRSRSYRAQIADSYEYSKNLTLSASLAMEIARPRVEKYDRFASVDLNTVNPANGQLGALVFANRNGRGRSLHPGSVRPELSLGLAWNPRGNAKSVLRLSYGLSYSNVPVYTTQWATQGFVGTPTFVSPNIQLEPALRLNVGMPPLPRPLPDLRPDAANFTNAELVDASGRVPIYQSAGLTFERELKGQVLVSISLGHARGQRLFVSNSAANPNAIPLSNLEYRDELNDEAFRRTLRPYSQYQRFEIYSSWPVGNYKRNAGVLRVEKRSSSGLSLNGTYEFSKQMDDYSGPYGIQDFYNRQNEWSLTSSNNPHRISFSFAYELPIGSKKALLTYSDWRRHLVDGWSISGITSLQSGEPLHLKPQFNNTGGLVDALRVNLVPGVSPKVANRGPDLWFNPAAFDQPADFTLGNGPRTHPQLLTPGGQNHDVSVTKRFAVTTERVLELTATGFNFTNTGNWSDPDMVIGPASAPNVNAGKIIGSVGGRVIQVGMRLSF